MISYYINKILSSSTLKQTMANFAIKFFGIFFSYVFSVILAKKFGSEGNGIFSIAMAITNISILFGKFGFDTALLKYTSANEAKNDRALTNYIYGLGMRYVVVFCIMLTLAQFFSSSLISSYFFKNDILSDYIALLSLAILPLVISIINSEGLRGLHKSTKYSFIQNLGVFGFATLFVLIASLFFTMDLKYVFYLYILSSYVVFFISLFWLNNEFEIKFRSVIDKSKITIKSILNTSVPMFWSNAMFVILTWTDIIMLGYYTSPSNVGVYAIAVRISSVIALPLVVINGITAPKFSEFHSKNDIEGLKKYINNTNKLILILTIPAFVVIAGFSKAFLNLFGSEFIVGASVLLILSTGQFFKSFCGATDFLLQMTGHEKVFQKIIIIAMLLNIILNFLLIPQFGIIGAAISNITSIIFWNLVSVIAINKKLGLITVYNPFSKN